MTTTKRCIKCCREFTLDHFPPNRRMPDGHLNWCFECFEHRGRDIEEHIEEVRKYFFVSESQRKALARRDRRRERERIRMREKYHNDPEFREREKQRKKAYLERPEVRERLRAYHREYYQRNKE